MTHEQFIVRAVLLGCVVDSDNIWLGDIPLILRPYQEDQSMFAASLSFDRLLGLDSLNVYNREALLGLIERAVQLKEVSQ